MNNIKRIFAIVIAMIFVLSAVTFASAETLPPICSGKILANENGTNGDVYIDADFVLNIGATLQDGIKGQSIGAVCYRTENEGTPKEKKFTVFAHQLTASAADCELSFAKFAFPADYPSGKYTVVISGDGITKQNSKSIDVYFYGAEAIQKALSAVVTADGTDIANAFTATPYNDGVTNADILKLEYNAFESLENKGKLYTMLDNGDTYFSSVHSMVLPDNAQDIMNIASEFIGLYNGARAIERYYDADSGSDVADWLKTYQSDSNPLYDFNGNASSDDEYLKQSAVLNTALESMKAADKTDNGNRADTMYKAFADNKAEFEFDGTEWSVNMNSMLKKITDRYREEIVLAFTVHMPSGEFKKLIEDTHVSKLFGSDVTTEYSSLNDTDKATVCSKVSGTKYESLALLSKAILDEIDDLPASGGSNDRTPSGGNTGGGSFGRGSSISISGAPVVKDNTNRFSDLQGSEWAREAIEYLYDKGIVNGKAEGVFDPNANVTRSEFVKMIAVALGFDMQNKSCEFDDLNESMWQYPYIAAASGLGIVNGYSDGSFGINEPISRQDMAVIAERALRKYGKSFSDGKSDFTDDGDISQYARDAIANLVGAGIITGMPDGTYAPKSNVTRAQAAVIIYRALKM